MVCIALYGLAHIYSLVSHDNIIKHTKKCKYCRKRISEKVSALGSVLVLASFDKLVGSALHQLHELARWKGGPGALVIARWFVTYVSALGTCSMGPAFTDGE